MHNRTQFLRSHLSAIIGLLLAAPGLRPAHAQGSFQFDGGSNLGLGALQYALVANLNGDQKPDLLVQGAPAAGSVALVRLLGDGAGGFSSNQPVSAVTSSTAAALGDTTASGWASLAVLDNNAVRFLTTANGTYENTGSVAVPPGAVAIAAGDFNEDGHRDFAIVNASAGTMSVLLGKGPGVVPGPLVKYALKGGPCFIEAADLDHDGHIDLAVVCRTTGRVALFFGRGKGKFSHPTYCKVDKDPRFLAIGDLDHDGRLDLVSANYDSKCLTVLLQTKPRKFQAQTITLANGPAAVAIADLNCDGLADIAYADPTAGTVAILAGVGAGKFVPAGGILIGAPPACVRIADFNGDGAPDMWTVNSSAERSVTVLLNRCGGR